MDKITTRLIISVPCKDGQISLFKDREGYLPFPIGMRLNTGYPGFEGVVVSFEFADPTDIYNIFIQCNQLTTESIQSLNGIMSAKGWIKIA